MASVSNWEIRENSAANVIFPLCLSPWCTQVAPHLHLSPVQPPWAQTPSPANSILGFQTLTLDLAHDLVHDLVMRSVCVALPNVWLQPLGFFSLQNQTDDLVDGTELDFIPSSGLCKRLCHGSHTVEDLVCPCPPFGISSHWNQKGDGPIWRLLDTSPV